MSNDDSQVECWTREIRDARVASQEIISWHVVMKDPGRRDEFIEAALDEHGIHVLRCLAGFIAVHAADDVDEAVATQHFSFLLTRLGALLELLATTSGVPESELVHQFASMDFLEDVIAASGQAGIQGVVAMEAAQTCLVAHYFVRKGSPPWGIQSSLDLADMCEVIEMFGCLLMVVVDSFERKHWATAIRGLLCDVEVILEAIAVGTRSAVEVVVARMFMALMARDARSR